MPSISSLISSLPGLTVSASTSGPSVSLKRAGSGTSTSLWSATPETTPSRSDTPEATEEDEQARRKVEENKPTVVEKEESFEEPDEIDVADWIQAYSDAKRLATSRSNELMEKALGKNKPEPPDPDECCGSSCCPCVQDLWLEEVGVWKAVREGTSAEDVAEMVFKAKK